MSHTLREKSKLLNRLRRLRGQLEAVERALESGSECGEVMRQLAACNGAINSLLAEVVEGHVRDHLMPRGVRADSPRAQAADELIEVVHSYFR